jgi:hypothetical protein
MGKKPILLQLVRRRRKKNGEKKNEEERGVGCVKGGGNGKINK